MNFAGILDWIYPAAEPQLPEEIRKSAERDKEQLEACSSHTDPKALAEGYAKLQQDEMETLKSVETRLAGLLSLTSITATLLLSGTFAVVNGALADSKLGVRLCASAALFYLNLQLVCSTIAAIRGLGRAVWHSISIDDLVPPSSSGAVESSKRNAEQHCRRFLQTERNINKKVTQMAVAHTAIRNFAAASAVVAAFGLGIVALQHPENSVAKAIRKNSELQKLLTGPPGPAGLAGPPGPKGDPGRPVSPSPCATTHK
jgi:hypothetical protein